MSSNTSTRKSDYEIGYLNIVFFSQTNKKKMHRYSFLNSDVITNTKQE